MWRAVWALALAVLCACAPSSPAEPAEGAEMASLSYPGANNGVLRSITGLSIASLGSIRFEATPTAVYSAINDGTRTWLVDLSTAAPRTNGLFFHKAGTSSYFGLMVNGVVVGRAYTRHAAGELLRIGLYWGGTPTLARLVVNGWWTPLIDPQPPAVHASVPVLPIAPMSSNITFGYSADGTLPFVGDIQDVTIYDVRLRGRPDIGALGDSITREQNNQATGPWTRKLAELLLDDGWDPQIANAGVSSDLLADMLARLEQDLLDQDVDFVILHGFVNDPISDRTYTQVHDGIAAIASACDLAGLPIVVGTCGPIGSSGYYSAPREVVRARANDYELGEGDFTGQGYGQGLLDLAIDTGGAITDDTLGSPPQDYLAFHTDGIHLNQAGEDRVGEKYFEDLLDFLDTLYPSQIREHTTTAVPGDVPCTGDNLDMLRGEHFDHIITWPTDNLDFVTASVTYTIRHPDTDAVVATLRNANAGGSDDEVLADDGAQLRARYVPATTSSTTIPGGEKLRCRWDCQVVTLDGVTRTIARGAVTIEADETR